MRISIHLRAAAVALLLVQGASAASAQGTGQQSQYNWNGFYGGGNLGGVFAGSDLLSAVGSGMPFYEGQVYSAGPIPGSGIPEVIAAYSSNHAKDRAFTVGGQLGYNWFSNGLLVGFEVDANWMRIRAGKTAHVNGRPFTIGGTTFPPTAYTFHGEVDADYLVTARSRVGVPLAGGILYGTGGLAVTTFKYSHSFRAVGGAFNGLSEDASATDTKLGWTAGAGYELPISRSSTFKVEYLFAQFNNIHSDNNRIFGTPALASPTLDVPCGGDTGQFGQAVPAPRQCFAHKADLLLHMLRIGLNFKF